MRRIQLQASYYFSKSDFDNAITDLTQAIRLNHG